MHKRHYHPFSDPCGSEGPSGERALVAALGTFATSFGETIALRNLTGSAGTDGARPRPGVDVPSRRRSSLLNDVRWMPRSFDDGSSGAVCKSLVWLLELAGKIALRKKSDSTSRRPPAAVRRSREVDFSGRRHSSPPESACRGGFDDAGRVDK
jgi:hypothetical protein